VPAGWPATPAELIAAQERLAAARPDPWRPPAGPFAAAGCWVCFPRGATGAGDRGDPAWAAAALLHGRRLVASAIAPGEAGASYEPGLLALREGALLERAVRALPERPDVLLVDATGRDHPRRAGLALHLGAVLDLPTVGVTDRPLVAEGEALLLRTRAGARPVVVHPAWRTDLEAAVAVVLATCRGHRTPEPLRAARRLAREARARAAG
jgi:deoxyribonuclease V